MKGNKKILVIAILLLLVVAISGTYAIYRTSISGEGGVTAAAWTIQFKDGQTTLSDNFSVTFTGADCQNSHVKDGVIAPGASCSKDITLVATGSEVDVAYEVTVDTSNITATKGGNTVTTTGANVFSATATGTNNGLITYGQTMTDTITVVLTWAGEEGTEAFRGLSDAFGARVRLERAVRHAQFRVAGYGDRSV